MLRYHAIKVIVTAISLKLHTHGLITENKGSKIRKCLRLFSSKCFVFPSPHYNLYITIYKTMICLLISMSVELRSHKLKDVHRLRLYSSHYIHDATSVLSIISFRIIFIDFFRVCLNAILVLPLNKHGNEVEVKVLN